MLNEYKESRRQSMTRCPHCQIKRSSIRFHFQPISKSVPLIGPVHTTPFLYKNGEKNLRFCESVHTDLHKNATKTEVFENAVKSGYPQKRRFFSPFLYENGAV